MKVRLQGRDSAADGAAAGYGGGSAAIGGPASLVGQNFALERHFRAGATYAVLLLVILFPVFVCPLHLLC